jgi:hypothetical protein
VGLVDLSETGAGFFTAELLPKGVAVEVTITQPLVLKIRAIVAWSVPIQSGVAGTRYPCRSGLQFIFDNEDQRNSVKDFIEKCSADPVENYRRTLTLAPSKGQGQNADSVPQQNTPLADAATVEKVLDGMQPKDANGNPIPTPVNNDPLPAVNINPAPAAPAETAPAPVAAAPNEAPAAAPAATEAPAAPAVTGSTEDGSGQKAA